MGTMIAAQNDIIQRSKIIAAGMRKMVEGHPAVRV